MFIAVLSLLAGALSVLAPCVLPFLPVIVGGSVSATESKRRPYLIAAGLVVSLLLFTLLLKTTTAFIGIDPRVWSIASGVLVIALGCSMLFPGVWSWIESRLRLGERSNKLLDKAGEREGVAGPLLIGAALGPVFSSCSPTYAWVIATVLPAQPLAASVYLAAYCIGMAAMLLAISLLGRELVKKLGWAANPRGWFQRVVAVMFIIVGLAVSTGVDRQAQAWIAERVPDLTAVEEALLPEAESRQATDGQPVAAPELTGISEWINSDPVTLKQLRGQVVLVDFWTYSCINCIRTQPYLNSWYDRYHDDGFEIIGVHAPEFAFERVPENVEKAVRDADIKYPVALDNDFATWNAYQNRYWPAKYLIDQDGNIVWSHFGEGGYDEAEQRIRELVGAEGDRADAVAGEQGARQRSPETYLGASRASGFVGSGRYEIGEHDFTAAAPENIGVSQWTLGGKWRVDGESITALSDGATLSYRFTGQQMFLVMQADGESEVRVEVEGRRPPGGADVMAGLAKVSDARLYRLVKFEQSEQGLLVTLTFPKGVTANAFTFG